jgi:UDP-glucose 4-epimerase
VNSDINQIFSGKRALVTGGLGFIGSHLARRLVELGAQVSMIDVQDPQSGANRFNITEIDDRVHLVIADEYDEQHTRPLLQEQDFLFRLAGQTSHVGSMQDPLKDVEANAVHQVAMLEWCRKDNPGVRIIFAGTRQVYGRPAYLPVDEAHPIAPVDYNGVSKLAGDFYHIVCHQVYGMWTVVLRMTNVYGPHMRIKDARQTFIGWWLRQLLEDREIPIFGDGNQKRDLNHVDDVVDALLLCAANPAAKGQLFNLGGDPVALLDLARLMIEINGAGHYDLTPFPEARRSIDIGDYYGDFTKIQKQLGWRPKVSLRAGMERTLAFYRLHKRHYL